MNEKIIVKLFKLMKSVTDQNILNYYMYLIQFHFDLIDRPSLKILTINAKIIVSYISTKFKNGFQIPKSIDESKFINELLLFEILEQEKLTGLTAKIPTKQLFSSGYSQSVAIKTEVPKELLELEFLEHDNEYVDQKYLQEVYHLGKLIKKINEKTKVT